MSTPRDRENLARFGITANKAFGVSMANIQVLAKRLGRNHELAAALWDTGWYEARLLTSFVDEPARVTPAQMDRWCRDFDNWGICDTVCFHLFDRTPHAWAKVAQWQPARRVRKRAAFALIASLAGTTRAPASRLSRPALHRARRQRRTQLRQGVSWAIRLIGDATPPPTIAGSARRLSESSAAARWIGKGAVREPRARWFGPACGSPPERHAPKTRA
jgi:3-methyladenine DNA glycosylase AlkD